MSTVRLWLGPAAAAGAAGVSFTSNPLMAVCAVLKPEEAGLKCQMAGYRFAERARLPLAVGFYFVS